jgi:hypothetical protein
MILRIKTSRTTPVQEHAMGDVAPQARANTGAHGRTQANNRGGHGNLSRTRDDTEHGDDTEKPKSTSKKLPEPVLDANDVRLPVVKKETQKEPELKLFMSPAN